MDGIGKVDDAFLERAVYDRLGAPRSDVLYGPGHGRDFGVIEVGDRVIAVATDPLFVPLELGVERGAWYGFHIVVSDVALSGLPPSHLAVTVTLPPAADLEVFERVWTVIDEEATAHDVAIAAGHTGRYEGCTYPYIGGATAVAVGEETEVIRPTGAAPGDVLVATKGPAVETIGVLAMRFPDALEVPDAVVAAAQDRFWEISAVPDARAAARIPGVTAMHDATERGVDNALHELAAAADVELRVERERFPTGEGVMPVCAALGIDPWTASSEGTVLVTVDGDGAEELVGAFEDAGIRAAVVGSVESGSGVVVDGEPLPEPDADPFWGVYTDLAEGDRRD